MTTTALTTDQLKRFQLPALIVGLIALALCAVGAGFGLQQALRSYLLAHVFWWGIAIGCLGLTMLNHLVGGRWGFATRPIFTAGISTLPLLAILFVPVAVGLQYIYIWADADAVAADARLQQKAFYLEPSFFRLRALGYFVVWIVFGLVFSQSRVSQAADKRAKSHASGISGVGLVLFALTVSFAAMDWLMSLEPNWYSTIYGGLIAVGGALTALALVAAMVALGGAGALDDEKNVQVLHDLSSLLMAFILLWAYFAFSQFLIIWSGNLPDEIRWYLHRLDGGWQWLAVLIVLLHFAVPFIVLLSRERKRDPQTMLWLASMLLVIHYVELFWNVAPAFSQSQFRLHWLDLAAPLAVGGLWVFVFIWQLRRRMA